jgi:hypothetical protein
VIAKNTPNITYATPTVGTKIASALPARSSADRTGVVSTGYSK